MATTLEVLAARVHQAYLDTCARLGWDVKPANAVPYAELPEDAKELDRASVRAVLAALPGACPTCAPPMRETVGMVCQTCGTDYGVAGVTALEGGET